ncbi:hypothetical protein SCORR_v1c06690 [Spiroplasma corruscae]|uniref:Transmembrane protein n=1 Tax=Spiroplasma corruscae TaxID=216934 RepID=A0A222EQ01_9MOLU|nr:hypothetical protein [Spiroplasma corruscae]ASP28441.1 hypothetical protein SCORR_v1c06690 [Spiroplasma corruscae]
MSLNKKYLIRTVYSAVVLIFIIVSALAIGTSSVITDGKETITRVFKGWGKDDASNLDNNSVTTGFGGISDLFDKSNNSINGLSKNLVIISVIAFIFALAYFLYNIVLYSLSFKKDDLLSNKIQLILDLAFTVLIALMAVIFLSGMGMINNDLNKTLPTNSTEKWKLGTNFIASAALILIGLIGHVVGVSLLNTKYK